MESIAKGARAGWVFYDTYEISHFWVCVCPSRPSSGRVTVQGPQQRWLFTHLVGSGTPGLRSAGVGGSLLSERLSVGWISSY